MRRRYSFSIRGLMMLIVVFAVGLVALRTPSRIWANAWFSIAIATVSLATVAAVTALAESRAYWTGFAICGGVYFLFSLAPWIHEHTGHQLVTTAILDMASPLLIDNTYMLRSYMVTINPPAPPKNPTPWQVWNLPDFRTSSNENWTRGYVTLHSPALYLQIGHALFCVLAGIVGGEVARFRYLKRTAAAVDQPSA